MKTGITEGRIFEDSFSNTDARQLIEKNKVYVSLLIEKKEDTERVLHIMTYGTHLLYVRSILRAALKQVEDAIEKKPLG